MLTEAGAPQRPPAEQRPDPIRSDNLWDLKAEPHRIDDAADGWRSLARAARDHADTVDRPAQRLHESDWRGDTAETYHEHRLKLTGDMREVARIADSAADALSDTAANLRSAQSRLDESWTTVTACPHSVAGDSVTFQPRDDADVTVINNAIREAGQIRDYLDDQLLTSTSALSTAQSDLRLVSAAWASTVNGTQPFTLPPEVAGTGTILDFRNQRFILNTGAGNDQIEIRVDPQTGKRTVVVNGVEHPVPDGMEITVRTGGGDDTITVPPGARVNLTVLSGDGQDRVRGGDGKERVLAGAGNDTVEVGEGDDRVSGGAGNDYVSGYQGTDVLSGGAGNDTVYGGSGDDQLSGGEGRDYLEGGQGDDSLAGGSGGDQLSGGRGADQIAGGSGDDVIYTGRGEDTASGGTGTDTVYGQTADGPEESADALTDGERVIHVEMVGNPGDTIIIEGSDEFRERVQDDLDMLRSSPRGEMMLSELDRLHNETGAIAKDWPLVGDLAYQGDTIRIRELNEDNGYASNEQNPAQRVFGHDNYLIQYNPRFDDFRGGPPVVVLYHEAAHVYDFGFDTAVDGRYENPNDPDQTTDNRRNVVGVPNLERQAAGLPIDADGDGDYEIDPDHPIEFTENGLREELGVPRRDKYGS